MTIMTSGRGLDGWERRLDRAIALVPYISLAMSTALALLVVPDWTHPPLAVTLTLVGVAAGWMLWFVTLHPRWADRRGLMVTYYVVLIGLLAALISASPLFGFFSFTGYVHAVYALRGRWRFAGVAATGSLAAVSQVGGYGTLTRPGGIGIFVVVLAFNVGVACAMALLAWRTNEQSERRRQTISELAEANERLAAALAENAGLHAQLLAQAREAGVLDERQRMAGEIHDTLAQGLTGIITQLEAADQASDRPADASRHMRNARALARESLAEARRSVHALRPQPLDRTGLPQALADVAVRWAALNGVSVDLVTTGTVQPLLPEIEVTLLRTAQEALANVAKHAGAGRVALTLSYMEDLVTLDIRDDGGGFDPAAQRPVSRDGGFGLTAMRERLRRIAGTLTIESEPGSGTAVSACVPAIAAGGAA